MITYTLGADTPANMASGARAFEDARSLKLKLTGEPVDAERVRACASECHGMAADLTVFDPRTIADLSTYERPTRPRRNRYDVPEGQRSCKADVRRSLPGSD